MELSEIGNLIRSRRDFLKLKQEDLAELSGVGIKTINQIENGKGNPSLLTLEKIFNIVGVEIKVIIKSY